VAVEHLHYSRAVVASRPVRVATQPPHLAGREELLTKLEEQLAAGNTQESRVVTLHGLGGVGKTSIAVEYAHRHLSEYGLVWQFAAEDPAVMAAGFGELAEQLGVRDLLDQADPVTQVHAALAASSESWLLIFDNAPDAAAVRSALPPADRGQVIITSRNPHWPAGQAIEVPILGLQDAVRFLLSRVDATGTVEAEAAQDLARDLGRLPLALEQAAAYVQSTGRSIAEYLALFRKRHVDILLRGDPLGYDKRVATTWTLAFEQLRQADPQAITLLRLLSCYAPDTIPIRLLLQSGPALLALMEGQVVSDLRPLLEDSLAVDDAVIALRRYSLISPPVGGVVSVHPLVQAVTRDQLPGVSHEVWRQTAADLLKAALPKDPEQPHNWPVYAILLPHVNIILANDAESIAKVANYLGHSGNYSAALALYQSLVDIRGPVTNAENPHTLAARGDVAYWTGQAGDVVGAQCRVEQRDRC
jgi:hypothetical protein